MEKLFDIFQTEKLRVKDDILRIDKLIHSDLFLKGIGANASEIKTTINFPIVRNYLKAAEMLVSETVYDMPKPWPYQCFMEVWEEENGRIMFGSHVSDTKGSAIDNYLEEKRQNYGDFSGELFGLIEEKYSQHNIKEFLLGTNASKDDIEDWIAEDPEDVICNSFPNEIEGFINGLIKTSFYIGLSNSAFYTRVLEAFETGGIPAGWVGPTPENGGGLPKDCMQLLHYGSQFFFVLSKGLVPPPSHEPNYDGYCWYYEAATVIVWAIDDENFNDHEFYPTKLMSWRKN